MNLNAKECIIFIVAVFGLAMGVGGVLVYTKNVSTDTVSKTALHYQPRFVKNSTIQPRSFPPNQLNAHEKSLFLALHNKIRQKNDAGPLEWDDRLADSAQAWADKLLADDCAIYHPKNAADDEKYLQSGLDGQNLSQFIYKGRKKNVQVGSIKEAVQLWTDECKLYDPNEPTQHGVGHFTQMIWKDTTKVGCAYRKLDRLGKKGSIYVCHYNKSGNWLTAGGGYQHFNNNVKHFPNCEV
jgi:pathogenesis-related protein 1